MIDILIEIAIEAGITIRKIYESGKFSTSIKSDKTPVTTADEEANKTILRGLNQQFPKMPAISEESENRVLEKEAFFIIDPLDGTKGFLNKTNNFTVNIAFINNREPELGVIYSPISGELFYTSPHRESFKYNFLKKTEKVKISGNLENREALTLITSENHLVGRERKILKVDCEHDTLKIGSSIKFCRLAEGKADIYPRFGRTMEWDTAAGHAILKYAGGSVIDINTEKELVYGKKGYENGGFIALRESKDSNKIDWQRLKQES
jgi:3'(2'), 5'-bisphosphate nucleotidase